MLGEICLFVSLAATGYAAFLSLWFGRLQSRLQQRVVIFASAVGLAALTITMGLLIWASSREIFGLNTSPNMSADSYRGVIVSRHFGWGRPARCSYGRG